MDRYEEALERAKAGKPMDEVFPELKESEDERIRKDMISYIGGLNHKGKAKWIAYLEKQKVNTEGDFARGYDCGYECCLNSHGAEWLEKQKEQPKEELVYRMNGLMQEYCKAGADAQEKEHRLKCYQLFWDALEDAEFFEQKEQKPNYCHHEVDETGWTEEYRKAYYDGWNNCNMQHIQLKAEQKPAEWIEEDKKFLKYCCDVLDKAGEPMASIRLENFRPKPHWKPSEEQMLALERLAKYPFDNNELSFVDRARLTELVFQLKKLM